MSNISLVSSRTGDQLAPIEIFTADEQRQVDLYEQYWLYCIPPCDGTDLYKTNAIFIRRGQVTESNRGGTGLAKAKGLRDNTRALFNFAPFVYAKNREMLSYDAKYTGIRALNPEGEDDETKTAQLQKIIKKDWKKILGEVLANGLVTGNAYLLVEQEPGGRICWEVLYSNHVFLRRNPMDIDDIQAVEVKFSYQDDQGCYHTYKKVITPTQITEEVDGKPTEGGQRSNPLGWIPIVQIKNLAVPGKANGLNCFSQHLSDIDEVNEMAGDWQRAVSFYGTPHLVVSGTSISGEFKSDVGSTTELPEGGTLKYLEYEKLGDQLKNILALGDLIKSKMPEYDLNKLQQGATELSGYAIFLKLSSLLAKVKEEQCNYEEGFAEAGRMTLAILYRTLPSDQDCECDMGEILQANIIEKLTRLEKEKLNGWTTDEIALKELGKPQVQIDEIMEEKEEKMDLAAAWEAEMAKKGARKYVGPDGEFYKADMEGALKKTEIENNG